MKTALAIALILLPALGHAQTGQTVISCVAPTLYTNNTPIPAGTVITYTFSRGASAAGPFTLETKTATSCAGTPFTGLAQGVHYFVAVATANNQPSAQTAAVARPIFTPSSPTIPQGTLGGRVFSIQPSDSTSNSIVFPDVGSITAGKPCDYAFGALVAGKVYLHVAITDAVLTPGVDKAGLSLYASCQ